MAFGDNRFFVESSLYEYILRNKITQQMKTNCVDLMKSLLEMYF